MPDWTENDRRLARQRLLAYEEGRYFDARLIGAYLIVRRRLQLTDIDCTTVPEEFIVRWGIPPHVRVCSFFLGDEKGLGEAVWRLPYVEDGNPRPVGPLEIPTGFLPLELVGSIRLNNAPLPIEARMTDVRRSWIDRMVIDP